MRKPKHGEIWQVRKGNVDLFLDNKSSYKDQYSKFVIPAKAKDPRIQGWMNTDDYDEKGQYRITIPVAANRDWDVINFIGVSDAVVGSTAKVEVGCKHEWKETKTAGKTHWCSVCGEYK